MFDIHSKSIKLFQMFFLCCNVCEFISIYSRRVRHQNVNVNALALVYYTELSVSLLCCCAYGGTTKILSLIYFNSYPTGYMIVCAPPFPISIQGQTVAHPARRWRKQTKSQTNKHISKVCMKEVDNVFDLDLM